MNVVTTGEAAKFLGISTTRVRQYLHEGRLKHGGYRRNANGKVVALVEHDSLMRLKGRRERDLATHIAGYRPRKGW